MGKYHQIQEGEWTPIPKRGHKNACCHCGLVHVFTYRIADGAMEFRAKIDKRATAAMRRAFKFSKEDE